MPTTRDDVWLCLNLYEQRREPELRAARSWLAGFNPKTIKDIVAVTEGKLGDDANRYWRQATSYWEMIAALLSADEISFDCRRLFAQTTKEWFWCYSKLQPFLNEIRAKGRPAAFMNLENFARSFPEHDEWLAYFSAMSKSVEKRRKSAPKRKKRAKR